MTDRVKGAVIGALLLLLALALIGDFFLYHGYTGEKSRADVAETNLATANKATKDANTATEACNTSIEGLEKAARKAGEAAGVKREAARQQALKLQEQAQSELSRPATVPGDDCKSAQDRVTRILSQRGKR